MTAPFFKTFANDLSSNQYTNSFGLTIHQKWARERISVEENVLNFILV
jgi:hypothetical protein